MRLSLLFTALLVVCICAQAQKGRYDSIREVMRQDSIEYEQQLRDADRIKQETDSILRNDLGHVERITPQDSATVAKNVRAIAAQELQKQAEEEKRKYYLFVGVFLFFVIMVIVMFKRKQFAGADDKNP